MFHFWPNFDECEKEQLEQYMLRSRWFFIAMLVPGLVFLGFGIYLHNLLLVALALIITVGWALCIVLISYGKNRIYASIVTAIHASFVIADLIYMQKGAIVGAFILLYLINQTRAAFIYADR
ncbi:hypothetical protein OIU34_24095 [Pararhizobium sp. BT-229]|uniref:hypothetical protein n=1 Tax=Pararhizobium sp. BT-229 TaxID=2986923 RepID=UPI0021F6EFCD|nr:hypothetical protein [Pararhizobium sp. BT-229]MCV9964981.1 hypothetical protein [Pararhizobium sp. BT-229]